MKKTNKATKKALAMLVQRAKEVQKGNLKAAYGAYRVHTRS